MANGLVSSSADSGQTLANLFKRTTTQKTASWGNSGRSGSRGSDRTSSKDNFADLLSGAMGGSSRNSRSTRTDAMNTRPERYQRSDRSSNSTRSYESTGSEESAGTTDERSQTQGRNSTQSQNSVDEAMDRLAIMVRDGKIDIEDLDQMSDNELAGLMAWLMAGADGQFEPVNMPEFLSGAEFSLSAENSVVIESEESGVSYFTVTGEEIGDTESLVSKFLTAAAERKDFQDRLKATLERLTFNQPGSVESVDGGPEFLNEENENPLISLISSLNETDLDELDSEQLRLIAQAFIEAVSAGNSQNSQANGESLSGLGQVDADSLLQSLGISDLEEILSAAAEKAGGMDELVAASRLSELSDEELESLGLELLKISTSEAESADSLELSKDALALLEKLSQLAKANHEAANASFAEAGEKFSDKFSAMKEFTPEQMEEVIGRMDEGSENTVDGKGVLNPDAVAEESSQKSKADMLAEGDKKSVGASELAEKARVQSEKEDRADMHNEKRQEWLAGKGSESGTGIDEMGEMSEFADEFAAQSAETSTNHFFHASESVTSITETSSTQPANMTTASADTTQAKYVDTESNIEKLSQALRISVKRGLSSATMQLSPAHLGKVKLEVSMTRGELTASVKADSVEARDTLIAGLNQLRTALHEQGITIGDIDISYHDGQQETQSGENFAGNQRHNRSSGNSSSSTGGEAVESVSASGGDSSVATSSDGLLNMVA